MNGEAAFAGAILRVMRDFSKNISDRIYYVYTLLLRCDPDSAIFSEAEPADMPDLAVIQAEEVLDRDPGARVLVEPDAVHPAAILGCETCRSSSSAAQFPASESMTAT